MKAVTLAFIACLFLAGAARAQDGSQSEALKVRDGMREDLNDLGTREDDAIKASGYASPSNAQPLQDTVSGWAKQGAAAVDALPMPR